MRKLILPLLLVAAACSNQSKNIYGQRPVAPPPQPAIPQYDKIPEDQVRHIVIDGGTTVRLNPQIDILFVIDNSESMKSAQDNLSRNINRFVEGFQNNRMIDYHIGVISVWDSSERFAAQKKDKYGIGELRSLRDPEGRISKARFVTRFKNNEEILASTLKLGVAPYADGGPEVEEVFSPLSAALKKTAAGEANENFFRPDAQLVVIVITDADDSTGVIRNPDGTTRSLSPEQMAQELIDFKGGKREKVAAYGALVSKSDPDERKDYGLRVHPSYHPECFDSVQERDQNGKLVTRTRNNGLCKQGFGPDRLEQFILAANPDRGTPDQVRSSHIMSLVQEDFGRDLARIGSDLTVLALEKEILLPERPRQEADGKVSVVVRYGLPGELAAGRGQLIEQKLKGGWHYDPEKNAVRLPGDIQYNYQDGAQFLVDMIPVNAVH